MSYHIAAGDYDHGGTASQKLKEQLKQIGAGPRDIRRTMIASYEAEMNVVIHSVGGRFNVQLENDRLNVEVADDGPGIPDIGQAMKEGYSTAPAKARELGFGAGLGLPNIRRNSDRFAIESAAGRGTRVRFTIFLKPAQAQAACRHSIQVASGRCKRCLRCLQACPTRAMRVRAAGPQVLDYLCVDCTACIDACPSEALGVCDAAGGVVDPSGATLLVPPAVLAQYGPRHDPRQVLEAMRELGFADVVVTHGAERSLMSAVLEHAGDVRGGNVIAPVCPAVLNLIQTRFASLIPNIAPFAAALEAAVGQLDDRRLVVAVTCPSQRSLLAGLPVPPMVVLPAQLQAMLMPRLAAGPVQACGDGAAPAAAEAQDKVLRVTGIRHVAEVLEQVENGLLDDVAVLELWACDEGCFGSPLLSEDAYVARRRYVEAALPGAPSFRAQNRAETLPPRAGLRLDEEMTKAIVKFATIGRIVKDLPGYDCGMCGCPACEALAEDAVMGRAELSACPHLPPKRNGH